MIDAAERRILRTSLAASSALPAWICFTSRSCSAYGRARLQYLKEYRSNIYTRLLLSGKLYVDLNETDAEAQRLLETIIPAMAKQAGVTEKLKAVDPSQWIGMMNVFKAQVEEMIWKELICV